MKTLRIINVFALGLPTTLGISTFFYNDLWFWAAWSTMLTGLLQIVIAIAALIIGHNKKWLYIYLIIVALYFTCMKLRVDGILDINSYYLYITPPLLALYLTFLLYKKNTLNNKHHDTINP